MSSVTIFSRLYLWEILSTEIVITWSIQLLVIKKSSQYYYLLWMWGIGSGINNYAHVHRRGIEMEVYNNNQSVQINSTGNNVENTLKEEYVRKM